MCPPLQGGRHKLAPAAGALRARQPSCASQPSASQPASQPAGKHQATSGLPTLRNLMRRPHSLSGFTIHAEASRGDRCSPCAATPHLYSRWAAAGAAVQTEQGSAACMWPLCQHRQAGQRAMHSAAHTKPVLLASK